MGGFLLGLWGGCRGAACDDSGMCSTLSILGLKDSVLGCDMRRCGATGAPLQLRLGVGWGEAQSDATPMHHCFRARCGSVAVAAAVVQGGMRASFPMLGGEDERPAGRGGLQSKWGGFGAWP